VPTSPLLPCRAGLYSGSTIGIWPGNTPYWSCAWPHRILGSPSPIEPALKSSEPEDNADQNAHHVINAKMNIAEIMAAPRTSSRRAHEKIGRLIDEWNTVSLARASQIPCHTITHWSRKQSAHDVPAPTITAVAITHSRNVWRTPKVRRRRQSHATQRCRPLKCLLPLAVRDCFTVCNGFPKATPWCWLTHRDGTRTSAHPASSKRFAGQNLNELTATLRILFNALPPCSGPKANRSILGPVECLPQN